MKLTIKDFYDQNELRSALIIKAKAETENNHKELSFIEGEPEDANLGRDYSDVYNIEDLLKMAYDAGKNNETLEIDHKSYGSFDKL